MGQTGPYAKLAGYGNVGAALSGFQDIVGWPDRPAFGPFGPYTDYVGPRFSLTTLLAALDERRRTGHGCYIDVSQVEAGVYLQSAEMAEYALTGAVVHRIGDRDREFAPHGVYRCLDEGDTSRYAAVAVQDQRQWESLSATIGRADLAGLSAAERLARADELDLLVAVWTAGRSARDVERELQAAGVPAHVSASSKDFCTDEQLAHRGHLVELPHPLHGTATVEGPRYLLSETPGRVTRAAPTFGQDNEYVLTKILDYTHDDFVELSEEGVLR
jgi:benzylsuccinate CoA-transferase BbsF subunit